MSGALDSIVARGSLGQWSLQRKLGEGGMGVVFEARSTTGARAALKIVKPDQVTRDSLARFEREARSLMRVDHPNVVRILDSGEEDGVAFLALEFVDGPNLGEKLAKGKKLSPEEARDLCVDLLRG
ncbi:MAG: protein kinase, partial [Planctomycetota bacterium]